MVGCGPQPLDANLCPRDTPVPRTTVLLLDTSDPLSAKHEEELERIVQELQSPNAAFEGFSVGTGEALVVYEMKEDLRQLEPQLVVCNPGKHPNKWGWQQELTQGKQIALRKWRRFNDAVKPLFDRGHQDPLARSPIIETLGVILPRHSPSKRRNESVNKKPTHIIIFSDLLQHSEALSHYRSYPSAEQVRKTEGLRSIQTNLSGVDVSLFRLERPHPDGRLQSAEHFYWWTELIEDFGGRIIYQDSI